MVTNESPEEAILRFEQLEALQLEYATFDPFLDDVMDMLGFPTTAIQQDIGAYLVSGPQYIMIQAQRGQAKTTITAAYAVWDLIHNPRHRVLIISAGGTQANEVSTLIVRIIMNMEQLSCLRPDASHGDRTSVEAFDVHYTLKGIDKSPSVACVGISGNIQGKRADLLIADDVESQKNARTATMREVLLLLTKDFSSMCSTGRIVYLGTPQTSESIYNGLPARGFMVRIWPGRYPTPDQAANYGDMLAPLISTRLQRLPALATGGGPLRDQGKPIDPSFMTEEILQKKELDQGTAYFQLQHMLNTALTDAMRFPLKAENLVVMKISKSGHLPVKIVRSMTKERLLAYTVHNCNFWLATPLPIEENDVAQPQGIMMYIDPAGGGKNGDETGYAVTAFLNSNVFILACGGVPGGYGVTAMDTLASIALDWKVTTVKIEKNFGYGSFRELFAPVLYKKWKCGIEDDYVTGQKELRIIETLEPVMGRGSLIINEAVIAEDRESSGRYPAADRTIYSLFNQLTKITRDKDSLIHDDRLDALEGAVRHWVAQMMLDQDEATKRARANEAKKWMQDPMQKNRYGKPGRQGSIFNKYRK